MNFGMELVLEGAMLIKLANRTLNNCWWFVLFVLFDRVPIGLVQSTIDGDIAKRDINKEDFSISPGLSKILSISFAPHQGLFLRSDSGLLNS